MQLLCPAACCCTPGLGLKHVIEVWSGFLGACRAAQAEPGSFAGMGYLGAALSTSLLYLVRTAVLLGYMQYTGVSLRIQLG